MEKYIPRIGKNVIETLTLGMYEDPRFIYREYVQNAADQIDVAVEEGILNRKSDGTINITIDKENKLIAIEDNATGIESSNVLQFLGDVANSQKDQSRRKGFRGIGRLGGLGYCERLIFETSYPGEPKKNIITLDARQLRKIITDKTIDMDAATVISVITSPEEKTAHENEHFFRVILQDVTNEMLLEETKIEEYLSMVAPVPFSKDFIYGKEITKIFRKNNLIMDEYAINLTINSKQLYKAYKNTIYDKNNKAASTIIGVSSFKINNDDDGELLAFGWYGISDRPNYQIPKNNIERGLRLRKDNIGIGSEFTLSKFFPQNRQNLNYIGELHALSTSFIPNARRDYFNDNRTCQIFEQQITQFFLHLGTLAQEASQLYNRKKEILEYKSACEEFKEAVQESKLTEKEVERKKNELEESKNDVLDAIKKINKIKNKTRDNEDLKIIYKSVIGKTDLSIDSVDNFEIKNYPIILSQLNESQQKVVKEIFKIIEDNLPLDKAEMLKKKIAERYN